MVEGLGKPAAREMAAARGDWITVRPFGLSAAAKLAVIMEQEKLDLGEVQAIMLAGELQNHTSRDQAAVSYARRLGLTVQRTPAIYSAARKAGWIESVEERLDRLRTAGFWLRDHDYAAVLIACGETGGAQVVDLE